MTRIVSAIRICILVSVLCVGECMTHASFSFSSRCGTFFALEVSLLTPRTLFYYLLPGGCSGVELSAPHRELYSEEPSPRACLHEHPRVLGAGLWRLLFVFVSHLVFTSLWHCSS
uniref:T. congolense-specific, cell surface-expressed gene family n=1 Tax=Trypanosoma congolense (strain IL3000) TaxID=1068625 RepID=G0UKP8_TRYCI|nr:hypothetical protein, unlikely [Trypanosoma congolense IL3000]